MMTFKQKWEKIDQELTLSIDQVKTMVGQAFPNKELGSYAIISGGCANLNIKIMLKSEIDPFILRLYIRDKDAAYREKNLASLLTSTLPIPTVYFVGDYDIYRFGITQFLPGITLRDLLLSNNSHNLSAIMYKVGKILTKISCHSFSTGGDFDKDLNISQAISSEDCLNYVNQCLKKPNAIRYLNQKTILKIGFYFEKYRDFFPDGNRLVHADYDPANILVHQQNNAWEIAGILDWEFAFSGSPLWDVANMLRYAHQMPAAYETSFLQGLQEGMTLPSGWRISIHLLNLISLIDCLARDGSTNRPNQCADICELINHIFSELDQE